MCILRMQVEACNLTSMSKYKYHVTKQFKYFFTGGYLSNVLRFRRGILSLHCLDSSQSCCSVCQASSPFLCADRRSTAAAIVEITVICASSKCYSSAM